MARSARSASRVCPLIGLGLALAGPPPAAAAELMIVGNDQKVSWNEKLYWTYELTQGGQPFASYVNRNSAAGYLNLCLAGAVGLLVWSIARHRRDRFPAPRDESIGGRLVRALVRRSDAGQPNLRECDP